MFPIFCSICHAEEQGLDNLKRHFNTFHKEIYNQAQNKVKNFAGSNEVQNLARSNELQKNDGSNTMENVNRAIKVKNFARSNEVPNIFKSNEVPNVVKSNEVQHFARLIVVQNVQISNIVQNFDRSNEVKNVDRSNVAEIVNRSNEVQNVDKSKEVKIIDKANEVQNVDRSNEVQAVDKSNEVQNVDRSNEVKNVDMSDEARNSILPRCEICSEYFTSNWLLQRHIKQFHLQTFRCEFCPTTFNEETKLRKHENKFHSKLIRKRNMAEDGDEVEVVAITEKAVGLSPIVPQSKMNNLSQVNKDPVNVLKPPTELPTFPKTLTVSRSYSTARQQPQRFQSQQHHSGVGNSSAITTPTGDLVTVSSSSRLNDVNFNKSFPKSNVVMKNKKQTKPNVVNHHLLAKNDNKANAAHQSQNLRGQQWSHSPKASLTQQNNTKVAAIARESLNEHKLQKHQNEIGIIQQLALKAKQKQMSKGFGSKMQQKTKTVDTRQLQNYNKFTNKKAASGSDNPVQRLSQIPGTSIKKLSKTPRSINGQQPIKANGMKRAAPATSPEAGFAQLQEPTSVKREQLSPSYESPGGHLNTTDKKSLLVVECHKCGLAFPDATELISHIRAAHVI